jgi:hypothetical protein
MGDDSPSISGLRGMCVLKRPKLRPIAERLVSGIGGFANDSVHAGFAPENSDVETIGALAGNKTPPRQTAGKSDVT